VKRWEFTNGHPNISGLKRTLMIQTTIG